MSIAPRIFVSAGLAALVLSSACTGTIQPSGEPDEPGVVPRPVPGTGGTSSPRAPQPGGHRLEASSFTCAPDQLPEQPLRRLTAEQYLNTLQDVIALAVEDDALAGSLWAELQPALALLEEDERPRLGGDAHGTFRRLDQDVRQDFVEATFTIAARAGALLARPEYLARVVGPCASQTGEAARGCLDEFLRRFGSRVLRRPLDQRLLELYRRIHEDTDRITATGVTRVVGAMLAAPEFLYLVEHGDAPVAGSPDVFTLTPVELASRLSFHYWNRMPDQALWDAAVSGALAAPERYLAEVERLLSDERAHSALDGFFAEYWLTEELPALDALNQDKAYRTFAGAQLPDRTLRGAMIAEVLAMARHHLWERPGTFSELLRSDLVFARDPALAALYGLDAPWDGQGQPPALPSGARPGFLTRAALLARDNVATRPVLRGALLRTRYLCDEVPPPPDNAMDVAEAALAALPPSATTRERTEALTVLASRACASCHERLINPLGYALEGFDNLARARTEEVVIDSRSGAVLAHSPVDTRSVPHVLDDDPSPSEGPADLVRLIDESGKAHACFARTWVRYAYGRVEDPARDACVLEPLTGALRGGAPLVEVLRAVALTQEFRQRRI